MHGPQELSDGGRASQWRTYLVIKIGATDSTHVTVQHEINRFSGLFHWRFRWSLQKGQRKTETNDEEIIL